MKKNTCLLVLIAIMAAKSYSQCGTTNIAQGKTVLYSSTDAIHTAARVLDGNTTTDWWPAGGSSGSEDQYIGVDLGQNYNVCLIAVDFQDNNHQAADYKIQTSNDGAVWNDQVTITANITVNISHAISVSTRYVRIAMTKKAVVWSAYSIVEFKVYNTTNQVPTVSLTNPANNAVFTAGNSIVIDATAADADGTISKVEFYQGTTKLGEDASSPYSYSWANVTAGTYSLTALATDNATGFTYSSPVNITVNAASGGADWSLTGNAGTTAGTNFLGTTDNKDLVIKTNNAEKLRILGANGNIGIGVAAPTALLDVNGASRFRNSITADFGIANRTTQLKDNGLYMSRVSDGGYASTITADGSMTLTTRNDFKFVSGASMATNLVLLENGNLGIGIASPAAQLHTTGTIRFAGIANNNALTRVVVSDASGNLAYRDASTLGNTSGWSYNGNTVGAITPFGTTSNYALPFITNNLERMRIGANGNVGIGTVNINDASFKLFVEGAIRARKIKVDQLTWPDYVFDTAYSLMPLSRLEQFIQQNNHLPGIPAAAEVQRNGIDVGDNQATLLKKIEELTLYIIQQHKKSEQMGAKMAALEKKINALQTMKK